MDLFLLVYHISWHMLRNCSGLYIPQKCKKLRVKLSPIFLFRCMIRSKFNGSHSSRDWCAQGYVVWIFASSLQEEKRERVFNLTSLLCEFCFCNFLSIEYWPDPQRGIKEAYRVLKLGGKACLIGPVYPTYWLSRFFADVWMLFPKEEEYIEWFEKAGFKDVKLKRIGPKWYRGVRRHGLIMGCSVTGVKPASGDSPLQVICFHSSIMDLA